MKQYTTWQYLKKPPIFLLTSIALANFSPSLAANLALDRAEYTIGEQIHVHVGGTAEDVEDRGYVGMYDPDAPLNENLGDNRKQYESFCCSDRWLPPRDFTFTAPSRPGQYEFRLYDRDDDSNPFLLDCVLFIVLPESAVEKRPAEPAAPACKGYPDTDKDLTVHTPPP